VVLTYQVTDCLEEPESLGTRLDLKSCIAADSLMDADTHHITLDEGTQCEGVSGSIGNIIKDNMKNKYDMSSN